MSETEILSKEKIDQIKQELPPEPYKLMEIKPEALAKVNRYRNLLFYVNLPLIFGIPIALEGGFLLD